MASQPVIAADTPTPDLSGLAMLNAGYGAQAAAATQRSQDLAQALAAMRNPAKGVATPVDPTVDRLTEALMQQRYGQSMQDYAQTAHADQPWMAQPAFFGLDQPSGGLPAASTPAVTPGRPLLSHGGAAMDPSSDGLIQAWQTGSPQDGALSFDDLIPNQDASWRPSFLGAVQGRQPVPVQGALPPINRQDVADLEAKRGLNLNVAQDPNFPGLNGTTGSTPGSPASGVPDTSSDAGAAVESGLDATAMKSGAPPGMMFARYLAQPDGAAQGGAPGNTPLPQDDSLDAVSPLVPVGAKRVHLQLETNPSALVAMGYPVYRYDHIFDSSTDVHPDRSTSSNPTPGGSMHVWNLTGNDISTIDTNEYDASTQQGYINRAYFDAYTGEYLGSRPVVSDGIPFRLPNGTVVQYDPAPTFLDKWSDSWLGQAASETWDDIAGGALGGAGELLEPAAMAASRIPAAARFLLTGGAKWGRALGMPTALRASELAEADQLAALRSAEEAASTLTQGGARLGTAPSNDYRATFFEAHPELEGQVVVHHAVEQQALTRYPGAVSEAEMHSLENLRGIPNELNSDLHISRIRREWNQFYRENPNATRQQLLQKATQIDAKYGSQFYPPVEPQPR